MGNGKRVTLNIRLQWRHVTMLDPEITGKLIAFAKTNLIDRQYPHDLLFETKRNDLKQLCDSYANDPLNHDFAEKGVALIQDFDDIAFKKASETTYGRAKVNAVVTASRVRRTHLASFLAGKYSNDPNVGAKFKCWAFNAAAYSALQLRQAIVEGAELIEPQHQSKELLAAFADSATDEAEIYLSRARDIDETAVITIFNSACLEILSRAPQRIILGMKQLNSIPQPDRDCHAADISWHVDNYASYIADKLGVKTLIEIEDGRSAAAIEGILRRNADTAESIKDSRADLWEKEKNTNKALIAAVVVGSVLVGSYFVTPEAQAAMRDIVKSVGEIMAASISGDGGIAALGYADSFGVQLARASFGDGGIA